MSISLYFRHKIFSSCLIEAIIIQFCLKAVLIKTSLFSCTLTVISSEEISITLEDITISVQK